MIIKGVPFIIKYFSKKANAIIERKGIVDDKCKEWVRKQLNYLALIITILRQQKTQ